MEIEKLLESELKKLAGLKHERFHKMKEYEKLLREADESAIIIRYEKTKFDELILENEAVKAKVLKIERELYKLDGALEVIKPSRHKRKN